MAAVLEVIQEYREIIVIVGYCAVGFLLLVTSILLVRKITYLQRTIDGITKEVQGYLDVVYIDEDQEQKASQEELLLQEKRKKEEDENRIISAVLQEMFP